MHVKTWFIKSVFVNTCGQVIIYRFPKNVNGIHYLLHTVSRIFSEHGLDKIRICRWWTVGSFIFQVKIISLKPIMDGSSSYSIIPINNTNNRSIIFTISFFKAIKYNKCFLWLFILNSKKCFKRVTNETYFKRALEWLKLING